MEEKTSGKGLKNKRGRLIIFALVLIMVLFIVVRQGLNTKDRIIGTWTSEVHLGEFDEYFFITVIFGEDGEYAYAAFDEFGDIYLAEFGTWEMSGHNIIVQLMADEGYTEGYTIYEYDPIRNHITNDRDSWAYKKAE